jgi:hypothetical protein
LIVTSVPAAPAVGEIDVICGATGFSRNPVDLLL